MIGEMDHDEYLQLLAGEALDDLDAVEVARLSAHRDGCAACAAATMDLDGTLVALALAAPQRAAPGALEARILAAAAAEPHTSVAKPAADGRAGVPATPAPPAPTLPRSADAPSRGGWTSWLRRPQFALAAAGLAVVLAVASVSLASQVSDLNATLKVQDAAIAILANPSHVAAPLAPEDGSGATATAVYLPDSTQSYVMASGLAPTPAGKVYQLWAADAAGVHPLGTYTFDGNGTFVAPFGVDLSTAAAAMITLEPTGGSTGEPGPQVVFGNLPAST